MSSVSAVEGSKPLPAALSLDAGSRKALFWDRIAPKYAGGRIADYAGYEATLVRVQGLLSREHDVLEVGCGTGSTALRLAQHTRSLLATDVSAHMIGIAAGAQAAAWRIADLQDGLRRGNESAGSLLSGTVDAGFGQGTPGADPERA